MTKFEDLANNVQALMLAKLAMEMNSYRCATLYELARKRQTDVMDVWRGICRSSGQPGCSIPHEVLLPQR
jgi:hypothetical protein